MSDDQSRAWAALIANGKPERWKRPKPARKAPKRTAPGALERDVSKAVVDAAELMGVTLFRNNVGALQDKYGRWVTYGLCVGSSDQIGWQSVTVTPEMVGQQIAVFVAIETKRERGGTVTGRQNTFIGRVLDAGGRAGVARSVEDLHSILKKGMP